jgi:hypothetical protein
MSMSAAAKKCRCRTYTPQRRRGTGLRQKDDGGVGGPPSDVMDLRPVNLDSKNDRCRTYTPDGRRGTGLRQKDDGVGLTSRPQGLAGRMRSTSRRNYRCRTYTPRWAARNGTPAKGRWGGVNISTSRSRRQDEIDIEKKLSLQDLYPLSLVNPSERHCSSTTCSYVPLEVLAHIHLARKRRALLGTVVRGIESDSSTSRRLLVSLTFLFASQPRFMSFIARESAPASSMASYLSNRSTSRQYVRQRIHFGFGGRVPILRIKIADQAPLDPFHAEIGPIHCRHEL